VGARELTWRAGPAVLLAAAVAGALLARRARAGRDQSPGDRPPTVGDAEFLADERYVQDGYRPAVIGGRHTRVFDRGAGEAVVFVPIIRGLEVVYARQLRAFAPSHRVLIYERDEALERPVPIAARVEEIRALLDHLGIERAHVVGLGDAGVPALHFGRAHPDRALSLTSVNLGPRYRMKPYWLTEGVINPLTVRLPVERFVPGSVIRGFVVSKTAGGGALPKHLIRHMVDNIDEPVRVHKYSVMPVTSEHEMRDWAHTLRVPTLLIGRDDDPLAPVEELSELAAMLPDCRGVHILPDGGRYLTYTWADRVAALLRAHFAAAGEAQERPMDDTPGLV
jgi:pimeloyl-ACP methyl ester carboxylesterase